jgi:hypothetical protein
MIALTNLNGKLFAVDKANKLWMRLPLTDPTVGWTQIGDAPASVIALAGYAGKLFATTSDNRVYWRDAVATVTT